MLARSSPFALLFILPALISGCQISNNPWVRIHHGKNPDVVRSKLKLPNFRSPKERVSKFFGCYALKDWKGMESNLAAYSDLHFIKDKITPDFKKYAELHPEVVIQEPVFNEAGDRAKIQVHFVVDKIDEANGKFYQVKGQGLYVLVDSAGWEIIAYIGDPFWDEVRK